MKGQLGWFSGGIALGLVFFLAVLLVKPIGVSTQFVILDGVIWSLFSEELVTESADSKTGFKSSNSYLNKSGGKYAKEVKKPLNYSFVFVFAIALGAFISSMTNGPQASIEDKRSPKVWQENFGANCKLRYVAAFVGGVLVLYGARLAGGCTSGHMMSGIMQTSFSGYLFAIGAFIVAVPVAILLYRK